MLSTPKAKRGLFLASSLYDGLEDNNIRQVATLLLNKNADPNVLLPVHGVTPFHLVIGNDSEAFAEEVTKLFLRHGGDPNVKSDDGMTPVHVAAAWGRTNILQLLLVNGGDPLCLDNDRYSPFHYAYDGKYFKAVTMLEKYCENIQDEDEKPKYNMALDKILITNGNMVAEYIVSQDTVLDIDINNTANESIVTDSYNYKSSFSIMTVESMCSTNICNNSETNYKISNNTDEYLPVTNNIMAYQRNNVSITNSKEKLNHSLIDLDSFTNLRLSDVMEKEKSLVNKIIAHLSTTLTSDSTINETLYNYGRKKRRKDRIDAIDFDISFQSKENENILHKHDCCKNPRFLHENEHADPRFEYKTVVSNNHNKDVLRFKTSDIKRQEYSKNTIRKKCKNVCNNIPLTSACALDKSIINMSSNCNTSVSRKKKDITALTPSCIHNESIISKSPNFGTSIQTSKKKAKAITLFTDDENFNSEVCKDFHECKDQKQHSEYNLCKKYIAQSTPRRKKRYKFDVGKKKFDIYQQEDGIIINNAPKPVNLDKTNFLETNNDTISSENLETSDESSLLNYKKYPKVKQFNYCNNHLTTKLNEEKYDKDKTCDNTDYSNNLDSDKSINQVDTEFVTLKRDTYEIDSVKQAKNFTNNVKPVNMTESSLSYKESFVDMHDCDIKRILNEQFNENISNVCNLHTNNCNNNFDKPSLRKLIIDDDFPCIVNLRTKYSKQSSLSESHESQSSIDNNNDNSNYLKKTGNTLNIENLDAKSEKDSTELSYVSAQEEYKYEDPEEGIILLERRLCVTPLSIYNGSKDNSENEMSIFSVSSVSSFQSLPKKLLLIDNATLRAELTKLGDQPGPITNTTRQVYLKRLMRLRNVEDINTSSKSCIQIIQKTYAEQNSRIQHHLKFGDWINHIETYTRLENQVFKEFISPNPSRKWREGMSKTCFTYLLLDSRITQNLPHRSIHLTNSEIWTTFLNAIFYIGKGKRTRPFAHLYDAFNTWVSKMPNTANKKINRILDIWNSDCGVVCLHIFQNVIPVEAYTREAAMIDAIGTKYLGNCKSGEYYGIMATWNVKQKREFGRYLLYKALQIFLNEGERQLFPQHL